MGTGELNAGGNPPIQGGCWSIAGLHPSGKYLGGERQCESSVLLNSFPYRLYVGVPPRGSKGKVCILAIVLMAHQAGAYPGFCSMKRLGLFLLPLDEMPVHCTVTPPLNSLVPTYTPGWRGTEIKCVAQQHNRMYPPRA